MKSIAQIISEGELRRDVFEINSDGSQSDHVVGAIVYCDVARKWFVYSSLLGYEEAVEAACKAANDHLEALFNKGTSEEGAVCP